MEYHEEDYLALSGIQHFAFCRRQWALIHIEQVWSDNLLTTLGTLMHERAHDEEIRERRGDVITVRGLRIASRVLGISGQCDVVEFHADDGGCPLSGEKGLWQVVPVEYKRGRRKVTDADRLQLCAQIICLEEMLGCDIAHGYLYYGQERQREQVGCSEALRQEVESICAEMHELFARRHTPRVKFTKKCRSCSLVEICMPKMASPARSDAVARYMDAMLSSLESKGEGEIL